MLIILAWANGRSQSSLVFGDIGLTINTVIAILATAIRASLLVTVAGPLNQSAWNWFVVAPENRRCGRELRDMEMFGHAATSSWSSSVLLWRTKGRALAALGAVVVILSLALDTFAQQVLKTEVIQLSSNATSPTLPRTRFIPNDQGNSSDLPTPTSTFDIDANVPLQDKEAIITSLFASNITFPSAPCTSGNCTWPTTPSLGLCSSCVDIAAQIQSSTLAAADGLVRYTLPDSCELVLPNGAGGPAGSAAAVGNLSVACTNMNPQNFTVSNTNDSAPPTLPLLDLDLLGVPPVNLASFMDIWVNQSSPSLELIQQQLSAYRCSFSFCLQAYTAETTTQGTHQSLISTWNQFVPIPCSSPGCQGVYEASNVPPNMNVHNASSYQIGPNGVLGSYLSTLLGGSATLEVSEQVFANPDNPASAILKPMPIIVFRQDGTLADNEIMEVLWQASNSSQTISALADRIALGYSGFLRTSLPAADDALYHATVFTTETIVLVRWGFLALPCGLIATGHVFLLATILQTRRRAVHPWKAQRMPLLLAQLDPSICDGEVEKGTELDGRIGHTLVRLEYKDQDHQTRFIRAEPELSLK